MKNFLSTLLSVTILLCSYNMKAQKLAPGQQKQVDQLFKKDKVVYFSFMVNSMQQIAGLAKIVTVERTKGNTVYAHATKDQFSKFMQGNYAYTVIPHAAAKPKAGATAKTGTATKTTKGKKTAKKPAAKK